MTRGITISASREEEGILAYEVTDFGGDYPQLVEAVGGYIEGCPCDDDQITIWVNEEGKIGANNGQGPQMPRNLLGEAVWAHFGSMGCLAAGDWMAGSCVIVGGVDDEGETLDLDDDRRAQITKILDQLR